MSKGYPWGWCAAALLFVAGSASAMLPALSVYGKLPDFQMAAISPSGDHVAIIGTVEDSRQLVVFDGGNKLIIRMKINTAKVRGIEWAGDQSVIVEYSATVGLGIDYTTAKAELDSAIVVPIDGSKPWVVFAGNRDITGGVQGTYGVIQRGGRWYGYFGGFTMQRAAAVLDGYLPDGLQEPDLYEVDLQSQNTHLMAKRPDGEGIKRTWLVDAKGAVGASLDVTSSSGSWTIRNGAHQTIASGIDPAGNVWLVGFSPEGAGLIYGLRDRGDRRDKWLIVPLAGGPALPYLDQLSIAGEFEDRGHLLTGYVVDAISGESHFFDVRRDKIYKASLRAFPDARMTLMDSSDSFNDLLVTTEGPGDPITWWHVKINTGKAEILGSSYLLRQADVGPMRMVPYTAADGVKMDGVLTLPPTGLTKNLPAVILPHGGPTAHDVAGFDWIAQAFASRGYAVFQPNFRGSSGYGTAFELMGDGQWGRKMQTDISDGLGELVRQGIVDPKRVCIVGASYGGYAALAGVTLQQGLYRCAVAIAGLSDLNLMISDKVVESNGDPVLLRNLRQEIGTGRDLKAISPIRYVDKVTVPILLIHGKNDTVVNFTQSSLMADALRRAGKTVDFVTLPGEDHWLSTAETRLAMLQASVDFVLKNNPPDP